MAGKEPYKGIGGSVHDENRAPKVFESAELEFGVTSGYCLATRFERPPFGRGWAKSYGRYSSFARTVGSQRKRNHRSGVNVSK